MHTGIIKESPTNVSGSYCLNGPEWKKWQGYVVGLSCCMSGRSCICLTVFVGLKLSIQRPRCFKIITLCHNTLTVFNEVFLNLVADCWLIYTEGWYVISVGAIFFHQFQKGSNI